MFDHSIILKLRLIFLFAANTITLLNAQQHVTGSFVDTRDGQSYRTIKIAGRWWMSQNLNFASETGSWTSINDSSGNQYGRFYDWNAAMKAAPTGWRIPTKKEFELLLDSLGGSEEELFQKLLEGSSSGFDVVLTGSYQEAYGHAGVWASFWSSTQWSWFGITLNPWRLCLGSNNGKSFAQLGHGAGKGYGFNVRCIKIE